MVIRIIKDFYRDIDDKIRSLGVDGVDEIERRSKNTLKVTLSPFGNAIYVNGEMAGFFDFYGGTQIFIGVPFRVRSAISQSEDVRRESQRISMEAERKLRDQKNRQQNAWSVFKHEVTE